MPRSIIAPTVALRSTRDACTGSSASPSAPPPRPRRRRAPASRASAPLLPPLLLLLLASVAALQLLPLQTHAAALTTMLSPHERSCFYAWVDKAGEKVGFYFAVQSGGSFDIDYTVHSPSDKVVVEGTKERQLDIIFTGNEVGEYSFCFENDMSAWSDKMIDFDITVESEPRLELPLNHGNLLSETSAPLEDGISRVGSKLSAIARSQKYFRLWENRGFATVKATKSKIFWYTVVESLSIVAISVGQVYFVKWLLEKGGGTKRYRV